MDQFNTAIRLAKSFYLKARASATDMMHLYYMDLHYRATKMAFTAAKKPLTAK